jgi:hypothetical protein
LVSHNDTILVTKCQKKNMGVSTIENDFDLSSLVQTQTTNLTVVIQVSIVYCIFNKLQSGDA